MHSKYSLLSQFFATHKYYGLVELAVFFKSRMFGKPEDVNNLIDLTNSINEILLANRAFVIISDLETLTACYISSGFQTITGYLPDRLLKGGTNFFVKHYCPADRLFGMKIFDRVILHQRQKDLLNKELYVYTSTFRFLNSKGYYTWMFNRMMFVRHNENNKPAVLLIIITDINKFKADDKLSYSRSKYNPVTKTYETEEYEEFLPVGTDLLSTTDLQILHHLSNGLDNVQIAQIMGYSEHTVKDYRKKMLQKTWCSNTSELLCFALRNKLI